MKKKSWIREICLLCLISLLCGFFVGCGNVSQGKAQAIEKTLTPEQAKSKLEKDYNIPFNADNFISMIKTNEIEKVKLFLQAAIDPNTRCMDSSDKNYYGKTVLMIATQLGNIDIVHELVDNYKADIKGVDNNQYNIFWSVIDSGKTELVKYFVEKGADINYIVPIRGSDALSYAIYKNQQEIVKALVENGADIKRSNSKYKISVIMYAVLYKSNEDMFKTLLQLGADINTKDSNGYTPLFFALLNKSSFETIKILVDNGADVNFKSGTLSCLSLAKQNINGDKQKIVDYLISHGAK